MDKRTKTSWILALIGTILVWFPIAVMLFTSVAGSIAARQFRMDYLLPAELALAVLIGGILLIWVVFRSHELKFPIILTFAAAVVLLFGSQGLAVITGLAHGDTGKESIWYIVVLSMLGLYDLAVAALGVAGVFLLVKIKRLTAVI